MQFFLAENLQIRENLCNFVADYCDKTGVGRLIATARQRKVGAAQSTAAVNGRQAAMFGHQYRDESRLGAGETTALRAASSSKPARSASQSHRWSPAP